MTDDDLIAMYSGSLKNRPQYVAGVARLRELSRTLMTSEVVGIYASQSGSLKSLERGIAIAGAIAATAQCIDEAPVADVRAAMEEAEEILRLGTYPALQVRIRSASLTLVRAYKIMQRDTAYGKVRNGIGGPKAARRACAEFTRAYRLLRGVLDACHTTNASESN